MHYLDMQNRSLFYDRQGTGEPGLVLVHGYTCDHTDWQAQVDAFQSHHQVIACDLPGHGASGAHPTESSIETFAADVAALLAALDLSRAVLVGHSMGCRVVIQAYLNAPDRVAGLILVDGSWIGQGDPQELEQQMRTLMTQTGYKTMARQFFADMFLDGADEALKQRLIERATALPEAVSIPLFARLVAWDAGQMETALSRIAVPLLLLQSTYLNADLVRVPVQPGDTMPWFDIARRHVPDVYIDIISDVGHFPMLEVPQAVNQSIAAFMSKCG